VCVCVCVCVCVRAYGYADLFPNEEPDCLTNGLRDESNTLEHSHSSTTEIQRRTFSSSSHRWRKHLHFSQCDFFVLAKQSDTVSVASESIQDSLEALPDQLTEVCKTFCFHNNMTCQKSLMSSFAKKIYLSQTRNFVVVSFSVLRIFSVFFYPSSLLQNFICQFLHLILFLRLIFSFTFPWGQRLFKNIMLYR
jgi:hypothetical protein